MPTPRLPLALALLLWIAGPAASAQQPQPTRKPAVPALVKPDARSAENAARTQLIEQLDASAATQTALRRTRIAAIRSKAQARARQAEVRATMLRLLGPLPERTPLNAQVLGETPFEGFRLQKILFDSQPGFHVTALLYLPPSRPGEKLPAIVMAPGHGATGKAGDFALASTFARNGFAVLSYDPIGQGERLQYPDPADPSKSLATRPTGEHAEASLQPMLLGESVAKYFLWDGMRAVDLLQSRPEIDSSRIGAFGCSGGGAMTALLAALDTRIAAAGTACYITSFDTLLPAIGPQDGEQSTPGWIAAGLDFPDWVELAAPRPYAIIATASDMFPYAGALASAAEARRFYALFDPASAGPAAVPATPITGPTLNPDTSAAIPPSARLQFIVGTGGHGNLRPLQSQIVQFFLTHLKGQSASPIEVGSNSPTRENPTELPSGAPPSATSSSSLRVGSTDPQGRELPPAAALQVTPTGQVSTSYPGSATVFSLDLAHARTLPPPHPLKLPQLQAAIRHITGAEAVPGTPAPPVLTSKEDPCKATTTASEIGTPAGAGTKLYQPGRRYPAVLVLSAHPGNSYCGSGPGQPPDWSRMVTLMQDHVAMMFNPLPSPAGKEEQKSPILGDFYLLNLRAELTGKTLLGLRVDDVIRAVDRLAANPETDLGNISAEASGHEALVLLHAAVLDPRLRHITLSNLPPSYRDVLATPLPRDIAEDIVPGVLLHYDIPELIRAMGHRVTVVPTDNPAAPQ